MDRTVHGYERERWQAWSNIFGNDPKGDARYARYRNSHTLGQLGM